MQENAKREQHSSINKSDSRKLGERKNSWRLEHIVHFP